MRPQRLFSLLLLILLTHTLFVSGVVRASSSDPVTPDTLWQRWSDDLPVFLSLLIALLIYNHGLAKLWSRIGFGRGVNYWRVVAFGAALFSIFVALMSPLEALSHVLFSAHMLQHILLIFVAAPLLVVSGFQVTFLNALPHDWQHRIAGTWQSARMLPALWRFISQPIMAWVIGVSVVWAWHIPVLYQAALGNDFIHTSEHLMFLLASMLFWWPLLKPGQQKYMTYGGHVFYLFLATLQGTLLGALLIFTARPWYTAYSATAPLWHLTPLQDQQLAGLVMWIPAGMEYLFTALGFFVAWLNALEKRNPIKPSRLAERN